MDHDDQEFVCVIKCLKDNSTHFMILPLIDQHVDNMKEMEKTLKNLIFQDLPKITEPLLNKFCIVYSPISKRCYRAKIITENYRKSCVKILFIDENITDLVTMTFIRQIPPDLMLYKSKLVEVSLHNFPFKKGFEKEMTRDLIRVMKNKTMNVLVRAFDDEGIPIVDLYKTEAPVLIYQEILDKFTPLPMIEDTKTAAGSVDESNSFKKGHLESVQSHDEEFLCTFAYTMGPYEIAIYPINDNGSFVPEEIRTTSRGIVNAAYLKKVTNPDYDTCYYACAPGNTMCYLSKIVNFCPNRVEIHLLEFDKFIFVQLEDLFVIPVLRIEGIVVTLNFRFDAKFDELIEKELNEVLKNQRINVVIRENYADSLLVVDMYEVDSNTLIYQKVIDKIIDLEKEEMKQKNFSDEDEEVDLITFDDVSAEQTFEQQKTKR